MAAEWLSVAEGVTAISEKIFAGLSKYRELKAADRKRLADLLDNIAKDVMSIAQQMREKEIPTSVCASIYTYSRQLPRLVERVYDKEIAEQLGLELAAVYDARAFARAILNYSERTPEAQEIIRALTSSIEAAAGTIVASANILRAM